MVNKSSLLREQFGCKNGIGHSVLVVTAQHVRQSHSKLVFALCVVREYVGGLIVAQPIAPSPRSPIHRVPHRASTARTERRDSHSGGRGALCAARLGYFLSPATLLAQMVVLLCRILPPNAQDQVLLQVRGRIARQAPLNHCQ